MIATRDTLASQPNAEPLQEDAARTPDLQSLYQAVRDQLMANVETLVAHAFASHAAANRLPIPAVVQDVLRASEEPAEAEPLLPEPARPTGNPGLDFLNEQLQKSAPALVAQSAVPTPPWLHPFTLPENVRFTRTPDSIMRWERAVPTADDLAQAAREAARQMAEDAARLAQAEHERARAAASEPTVPSWRRPFTLPPNVRFTRTPDQKIVRAEPVILDMSAPTLDAMPSPEIMPTPRMEERTSTLESADGAFRSVTVTKTTTTIDSVTVSSTEMGASPAQAVPELTALAAPMPEAEQAAAPAVEPVPPAPDSDPLSLHASIAQSIAHVPGWFTIIRQAPGVPPSNAEEQDIEAAAPALAPIYEDADSEGSAVLDRGAFLPELEDCVPAPQALEAAAQEGKAEPASHNGMRPVVSAAFGVIPERRAFGSHGIPAFESAVRFESHPDYYQHPSIELLAHPLKQTGLAVTREGLEQNARLLEGVLEDFGVRGEIIAVRPGPVVTLYEFEPAPGVKSSRVMNLSDDIARSMSAISARVAVVQGRNVIGIELPNERRETVFLRELVESEDFGGSSHKLAIALGKTIGGESVIVDLARMPHLLVAGTTGSGKSVAINTMILSLLYRLKPEECRLIMVDPKMLELSIYDGIPHLLTPVVTDSKKAVIALKWAVREMEDRYKKMSKVGVRNIDGFNARVTEAKRKGEVITRTVQTGFDRETGEAVFETEAMDLATLPYIVIIVDEMADLMMVAGKEIEGAIQRLAQMARAAGIHLIMATQRPSVDVITGTIKANFPTRISFQVTSKIDSRTILGEMGAEQLLGQGDMLHMVGGGRIARVHGPFVSDAEVEKVVWHLKSQGHPEYLDVVTADDEAPAEDDDAADAAVFDKGSFGEEGGDLYEQAVKVVLRDKKCSTSYIQRRLQVGYNKAASLVERMEKEGLVGPANPTGKREILNFSRDHSRVIVMPGEEE